MTSGRAYVFSQVEVADLAADVVGQASDPESLEPADHAPCPRHSADQTRSGPIAEGTDQAQTGYDHAAFGTKHE